MVDVAGMEGAEDVAGDEWAGPRIVECEIVTSLVCAINVTALRNRNIASLAVLKCDWRVVASRYENFVFFGLPTLRIGGLPAIEAARIS